MWDMLLFYLLYFVVPAVIFIPITVGITIKIGRKLLYSKYPELIFLMPLLMGIFIFALAYGALLLIFFA